MPVSLNNSKDIVANSVSVIKGNKLIDVLETVDAIQGLAPETLNSLEKLAAALGGDANYFNTVTTALSNKANTATTYSKTTVDSLLDNKVDDAEMVNKANAADVYTKTAMDTELNKKANAVNVYTKTDVDTKINAIKDDAPPNMNTLKN